MKFARTKRQTRLVLLLDTVCLAASVLFIADMVNTPIGWIDAWGLRWPPFWGHSHLYLAPELRDGVALLLVFSSVVLIAYAASAVWAKCAIALGKR